MELARLMLYKDNMKTNKVITELADQFKGREWIAQHPRNNQWYGIDNVLRCPITEGYATRNGAKEAIRIHMAYVAMETATRKQRLTT